MWGGVRVKYEWMWGGVRVKYEWMWRGLGLNMSGVDVERGKG